MSGLIGRCQMQRRRILIHRFATGICVLLVIPALLWWKNSITFVILLSLATQAYTSYSASEAADDVDLRERLVRIEALLEQRGAGDA